MYRGKRVLVAGGAGMVGRQLISQLQELAAEIRVADKRVQNEAEFPENTEVLYGDLIDWQFCRKAVKDVDYVFDVTTVKSGVDGNTGPSASVTLVPSVLMTTQLMEAARVAGAERFLLTSSYSVHPLDTEIYTEHEAWSGIIPQTQYCGWAKRMGELQAMAFAEQYGWNKIAIVRPGYVYGPWDEFEPQSCRIIPALVRACVERSDSVILWRNGEGQTIRDFIFSSDVARGMILALENYACCDPVNLGTGKGVTAEDLLDLVTEVTGHRPEVICDDSNTGRKILVMDIRKAREKLGFTPKVGLREGLEIVVEWYKKNRGRSGDVPT